MQTSYTQLNKYIVADSSIKITNSKLITKYISSFVLGDGFLSMSKKSKNASYHLDQKATHKDYVDWQADILSNLTSVTIHEVLREDSRFVVNNPILRLFTKTHPKYTTLRQRIYISGRKQINPHDLKLLDWEMLAIWFMDDGSTQVRSMSKNPIVYSKIHTDGYSYGDVLLCQKAIYEFTNIPFDIENKRTQNGNQVYLLRTRQDYAKKFLDGIRPYVLPSFEYKLDYTTITSK